MGVACWTMGMLNAAVLGAMGSKRPPSSSGLGGTARLAAASG